jgi:hypothetical protein
VIHVSERQSLFGDPAWRLKRRAHIIRVGVHLDAPVVRVEFSEVQHFVGNKSSFFEQFPPRRLIGAFSGIYSAGRQFPGVFLDARPVLPDNRNLPPSGANEHTYVSSLCDAVIDLHGCIWLELYVLFNQLHPR